MFKIEATPVQDSMDFETVLTSNDDDKFNEQVKDIGNQVYDIEKALTACWIPEPDNPEIDDVFDDFDPDYPFTDLGGGTFKYKVCHGETDHECIYTDDMYEVLMEDLNQYLVKNFRNHKLQWLAELYTQLEITHQFKSLGLYDQGFTYLFSTNPDDDIEFIAQQLLGNVYSVHIQQMPEEFNIPLTEGGRLEVKYFAPNRINCWLEYIIDDSEFVLNHFNNGQMITNVKELTHITNGGNMCKQIIGVLK